MSSSNKYMEICQRTGAALYARAGSQQAAMFLLGVGLLSLGLVSHGLAQDISEASEINYDTTRIDTALNVLFGYIEGSFGALVMVVSGLGAIMSSAFGQYRASIGCLVVAVGSFILRSFVSTFFNVETE